MAQGNKTGGRKAGTPNKATAAKAAAIAASGLTPLDFMLTVMRDQSADLQDRLQAARAAAPYVHPRLVSREQDENPLSLELQKERLEIDKRRLEYVGGQSRAKWDEIRMTMPMNRKRDPENQ